MKRIGNVSVYVSRMIETSGIGGPCNILEERAETAATNGGVARYGGRAARHGPLSSVPGAIISGQIIHNDAYDFRFGVHDSPVRARRLQRENSNGLNVAERPFVYKSVVSTEHGEELLPVPQKERAAISAAIKVTYGIEPQYLESHVTPFDVDRFHTAKFEPHMAEVPRMPDLSTPTVLRRKTA